MHQRCEQTAIVSAVADGSIGAGCAPMVLAILDLSPRCICASPDYVGDGSLDALRSYARVRIMPSSPPSFRSCLHWRASLCAQLPGKTATCSLWPPLLERGGQREHVHRLIQETSAFAVNSAEVSRADANSAGDSARHRLDGGMLVQILLRFSVCRLQVKDDLLHRSGEGVRRLLLVGEIDHTAVVAADVHAGIG
jgi:hypothetical protein